MIPDTIEQIVTTPRVDEGDHERFTHILLEGFHTGDDEDDSEFVSVGNSVVDGMINQTPVKALCGKIWVPGRDPGKYPVCPTCKEIAISLGWSVPGA